MMDLTIVGPGRAGMSIALAAHRAGHSIGAVVGRTLGSAEAAADRVQATPFGIDADFPSGELMLISSRDDVIEELASSIAGRIAPGVSAGVVHLSGLVPRSALAPLRDAGYLTGTFHPLQTLPNPDSGAAQLAGAWVGITADDLEPKLVEFAESLGLKPFSIADDKKSLYHAAAAAAANFPLGSLAMSYDLFAEAGVPFEAAQPLVEAIVGNAFELGPRAALTGPVARGDVGTVRKQLDAVAVAEPGWIGDFVSAIRVLARLSGNLPLFDEMLDNWKRSEASR